MRDTKKGPPAQADFLFGYRPKGKRDVLVKNCEWSIVNRI